MKKNCFIGLCLIGASVLALSSCGEASDTFGYQKEVVDGYYTYDATFQNGVKKSYKLNQNFNAAVIGNYLVCSYFDGGYLTRKVLDIENNRFTEYYTNIHTTTESSIGTYDKTNVYKIVVDVEDGNIDRWLKENSSYLFLIEDEFNDLKYSYTVTEYDLKDGEWEEDTLSTIKHECLYDTNGNKTTQKDLDYGFYSKQDFTYNDNNKIEKIVLSYDSYGTGEYTLSNVVDFTYDSSLNLIRKDYKDKNGELETYYEYTYDSNNNLLNEKYYSWGLELDSDFSYEYDDDNHLILETMKYSRNQKKDQQLCWTSSRPTDCKKEHRYEQDKLVYEHDTYYCLEFGGDILSEDEYYYYNNSKKHISSNRSRGTKNVYEYDDLNRIISESEYFYDDNDVDVFYGKRIYTYKENSNLILSESYKNESGTDLVIDYTYDSFNNLLEKKKSYRDNGLLNEDYKEAYRYDSNGLVVKYEEYYRNGLAMELFYSFEWNYEGTNFISYTEVSNPIKR